MLARAIRFDENEHEEWCFGHSFADYRKEQNQVAQDIYTSLREFKYDCFFALENGIDWYTRLGAKGQKNLLDDDILNVIQNRIGVLAVFDFSSELVGRQYSCRCSVLTEYSNKEINIEFIL